MHASHQTQFFYRFLGLHSLLIGLLPFFLPVYLYTQGLNLAGLSILIGVSGLSFSAALMLWQRMAYTCSLRLMTTVSLVCEVALVMLVGLLTMTPGAPLFAPGTEPDAAVLAAGCIGLFNGVYNAFFWTTQRTLFLQQTTSHNSGRQYGNFQIFVTLFLKAGILTGGFLLEHAGFVWVLALSAGISAVGMLWLRDIPGSDKPIIEQKTTSVGPIMSLRYQDHHGSRQTIGIDGIFLYLESHFWTLSLFLVVQEDFTHLGFAVVLLAAGFAVLFYGIKNRIDRMDNDRVYRYAVWLYGLSWLIRFTLDDNTTGSTLWISLLSITFFSSFFRLAFNKRFFDIARHDGTVRYLLIKSYGSQCVLAGAFLSLGFLLMVAPWSEATTLSALYLLAAAGSLVYLSYKQ